MKDLLIPLLLLVGLGTGLWFFASDRLSVRRILSVGSGSVGSAPGPSVSSPATKTAKQPVKPAPNYRDSHQAVTDAPAVAETAPTPIVGATTVVPKPSEVALRIVAADSVRAGMDAEQVMFLLGQPDLETTTIDHGRLRQIFVYNRTLGNRLAYIHLLDGRIQYLSSRN
jgi:hypothetical protein